MKRTVLLLLVLTGLLCACAAPVEVPSTSAPAASTTGMPTTGMPTTGAPTTCPLPSTPEATPPATTPSELHYNPLTGQLQAAPANRRPIAVMHNNVLAAMPQHGVSQAAILYETLIEGGSTRCMGVYFGVSDVEKLGSIRSARKYFVDVAHAYDALYVHAGGSPEALAYLNSTGWDDIDGVAAEWDFFYRDQDRLSSGVASEHTLFVSGGSLTKCAQHRGYPLTLEGRDFGLSFGQGDLSGGSAANSVTVYFNRTGKPTPYTKQTAFTYNSADGLYYACQYAQDYIDGNSGKTLTFRNVMALRMEMTLQADGAHLTVGTTGSGEGVYACGGRMIPIRWHRASVEDPYTYTLADGTPLALGAGSTYIAMIPTGAAVEAQ